jgi:hypothetical protein
MSCKFKIIESSTLSGVVSVENSVKLRFSKYTAERFEGLSELFGAE